LTHDSHLPPAKAAVAAFVCALAIVYASLIPFNFRAISLDSAWELFRHTPFYRLGVSSRADWIANLVMYVPLGLLVGAATRGRTRGSSLASLFSALASGAVLAIAVEFVQLYFPGRTVSLNDIVASILGAAFGGGLWLAFARPIDLWTRDWHAGGGRRAFALLCAYAIAYALISFFPYDFVVSLDELSTQIAAGRHALLVVPGGCDAALRCALKPFGEVAAAVPLGWLLGHWLQQRRTPLTLGAVFAVGLGTGAFIEIGQLLLVSGTSQGLSVLMRGLGIAAGYALQGMVVRFARPALLKWGRLASLPALPLYLAVVAVASGWPATPLSLQSVAQRWPAFHWLPFYYQYFVSEAHAVASALVQLALYAPLGLMASLWFPQSRAAPVVAGFAAACVALVVELSKAFIPGKHPDITDVLIGAAGAWLAAHVFQILTSEAPGSAQKVSTGAARIEMSVSSRPGRAYGVMFAASILLIIAAWSLVDWPVARLPLGLFLISYAVVLARWPSAWMIVVPACIPVLDLTPLTGRLYWDELDLVLLVTVAVRLVREATFAPPQSADAARARLPRPALALLFCSVLVSGAIGLYPLQPLDLNAFGSYLSHYNALRILKAANWAFVLLALLAWDFADRRALLERLSVGMAIGGVLASLGVVWERLQFPGLLDFSANYRVAGTFSAMHLGGAYIEAYLVATFPFVALQVLMSPQRVLRALWLFALGLVGYAVLMTYSRGGTAALLAGALVLIVSGVLASRRPGHASGRHSGSLARVAAVPLVLALVAAPVVLAGRFMENRFSKSTSDLAVRVAHWHDVVALMDSGVSTTLFGMGLGRFPDVYFWSHAGSTVPGSYSLEQDKSRNPFLRLGGGYGLFFDQRVDVEPRQHYVLMFRGRSSRPGELSVALCEKSLLYSAACVWAHVRLGTHWANRRVVFDTLEIGSRRGMIARPVRLSLYNPTTGTAIDVDNVSLNDPAGHELLRNGDFALGGDYWFFTSDDHLAWHTKSLPLHIFFEQGLFGLIAYAALIYAALARLIPTARSSPLAGTLLASIVGFLIVGLFDSVIDAPRHLLLFLLLLFMSWFARPAQRPSERPYTHTPGDAVTPA
jgi:VanZ family protein